MLLDCYPRPIDLLVPDMSDPILRRMDWLMEDARIHALIRKDLARYYKNSKDGRRPVPIEVTKRVVVLKRYKKWSYRQTEQEIKDSSMYRYWVRVYDQWVPDYTTINDLERLIRPATLHLVNNRLVVLAQDYEITQGYRLRLDGSVTASNIHYPTDSSLLVDGVRVLSRLLAWAQEVLEPTVLPHHLFSNHTRSARRRSRVIGRLTQPGRKTAPQPASDKALRRAYTDLINIARTSVEQARQVLPALTIDPGNLTATGVATPLAEFLPLVEQAIEQAVRRILQGEAVPACDKIVSLFEPHTQIIRRGKSKPNDTEFGHKVRYSEVERGFVTDWQLMSDGNPPDAPYLPPALCQHQKLFGHVPDELSTDRGFYSPENDALAHQLGIQHPALPQTGTLSPERSAYQKQAWFKKAQRFRSGVEGRISVVRRTVQLARCPYHGLAGFERWVGWGIIVANLVVMSRELNKPRRRKAKRRT
jgi:IS5 family transposase